MKITNATTHFIKPGWMILELSTDKGIIGYGEYDITGPPSALAAVTTELGALLRGRDPLYIEHLWQLMAGGSHYRGGLVYSSAVSAVEQALWDIKGKALKIPVYEMLGGACRQKVRMQARTGGDSPEDAATIAKGIRLKHYKSMKIALQPPARAIETRTYLQQQVAHLQAVRDEVGDEVDIAVTLTGCTNPAMAIRLIHAMEPLTPLFVEAPCLSSHPAGFVRVSRATASPLAAGDGLYTRSAFHALLEPHALAVVQPDVCQVGGILQAVKIAAMAEGGDVSLAPLNPRGPVSLAASLQVAACSPNLLVLDHPALGTKWDVGYGLLATPFDVHGGYIPIPEGPGLGIEMNAAVLRERAIPMTWDPPVANPANNGLGATW